MYKYYCFNAIAECGLANLSEEFVPVSDAKDADGILVRSAALHELEFGKNLKVIARAGAGVNNIPLDRCAEEGIVVFNTPGANANGVKELVLAGLLLFCTYRGYFFFREETRVGLSLGNKFFGEASVDRSSAALSIAAVISCFTAVTSSFVEINSEEAQRVYDYIHGSFYITLVVRIFYSEIKNSSRLVSQPLVCKSAEQVTQMDESRRTWPQPGDFSPGRKISFGEHLLIVIRRFFNIGKKHFC